MEKMAFCCPFKELAAQDWCLSYYPRQEPDDLPTLPDDLVVFSGGEYWKNIKAIWLVGSCLGVRAGKLEVHFNISQVACVSWKPTRKEQ